jgi:acetylornithine deacetylase/succinyl-diaminopimelate desuccinylase-like protein
MISDSWVSRISGSVDPDEVCRLALDLCSIPSTTGEEAPLADFIVDWFKLNGLIGVRQEVETGRANAVGILRGKRHGPILMLNGHMDTGIHLRHEEVVGPVPPKKPILTPRRENGVLYGTGMDNMKSGLAAIMYAAKSIKHSGIALDGDLIVAGVAGEVSRAPVDQYQGPHFRSKGLGTRYLLTHGIVSDYAIVADTSHFGLTWAQCGVVYAKITVDGRPFYTPFSRRVANPRDSQNAVIKMGLVIEAFEKWASRYERESIYRFAGGEVYPKANIGAIAGGVPFKVANSPIACSLYVDVRTPPGMPPIRIQHELRGMLDEVGLEYELELFTTRMGYEGENVEPLVEAISEAHNTVAGKPLPPIDPVENSMWTDTNLYNELNIPAVKFGIGAALRPGPDGELHNMVRLRDSTSVEDLIRATKIYALSALKICGAEPN